ANGLPVPDLRAEEVSLHLDGRPRPIRSLEYVSLASPASAGVGEMLSPYGSNTQTDSGRSVVLIIDQQTLPPARDGDLKTQIGECLRGLSAHDRVALVTVPYGGLKVDLTSDHSRVTQALSTVGGQAQAVESTDDALCRTTLTLAAVRGTLDDLRGGEAPVVVVLFSSQMSAPLGVFAAPAPSNQMVTLPRCQLQVEQFKQVSAAAAAAHAQFYVIQPALMVAQGTRAGLEHLAGVTGGPLLHLGSGEGSALARVTRESAGYYIARLEPEPSETNGTIRNLRIAVKRPDTTVRQRPQLSVARPATRSSTAAATTPMNMMKEARAFRDLPLRVTGFPARESGSTMVRVITVFDSPDPSAALSSAMVGLFDGTGRMVASRVFSSTELTSFPVVAAMSVPAGQYRLRVAAAEAAGRGGAADYDMSAELSSAGPLALSGLVMGLSRGGQFLPRLEFGSEASAMAQVEIYGGAAGLAIGAVFELARTANGPALIVVRGTFAPTTDPDRFIATAALPIGGLTPGDYVVRATVAADGKAGGRVLRALRKVSR
ncbi:MAG: hypothetical protein ABIP90_07925, partial [Vicinamibacterales bacterium]